MGIWEAGVQEADQGRKWEGEGGFIKFIDPYFVRGMRFVMFSNEPYIGLASIIHYRKRWTLMMQIQGSPSSCIVR